MWLTILLLSVIEGLTEFLPISSTGHLVVASGLTHFDPPWREPFLVVIQVGAIIAVVVARWSQILALLRSGRAALFDVGVKIALGFLPSAVIGLLLHDYISRLLANPALVSLAWVIGGVAILVVDRPSRTSPTASAPADNVAAELASVTPRQALLVGFSQCFALWPGMSRSGSTILGGLLVGLDRRTATLLSFYIAIPTMFAASGYELLKFRDQLDGSFSMFLVGLIGSFVIALATVRWLLRFVQTHTFRGFAAYRLIVGCAMLLFPSSWIET